jgi:hypothetical protein
MKNQLFALIGLGLLLATASAYAQTGVVKANVPFNFIVNKTQISAGQYRIQPLGSTNSGALAIESSDGKMVMAFLPNTCESARPQETTKLVFHRYGSQYFLSQIWTAGNERGNELPKSEQEREVAMSYPALQDVVVVATLR